MRISFWASEVLALLLLSSAPAMAQTNVITNGSFESGLSGWTTATDLGGGATGTCSYNGAVAPGTETLTSVAGFPATDGTQVALGSVSQTAGGGAIISCVLYQDVAIPAGATTATFSFDIGIKNAAGNNNTNNAARVGIYSTASVPAFAQAAVVGGASGVIDYAQPTDVTLQHRASASFNISSKAGQTVRFSIINAANNLGHENIGMDNVQFLVTVSTPTPVPTLSQWSLTGLALLLGGAGFQFLRRRTARPVFEN
ncbi:MAG TPA: IPTL-CTERM sorting domain-containing protein [Bryobacteraceae bacterium]|nr:IPTL-CTERM sorting domain-containing protein [Bryobacteraceae bacterium]